MYLYSLRKLFVNHNTIITTKNKDNKSCVGVCVCVCMCVVEYYSAIKTRKIVPFAISWMDLEDTMLNETSGIEKDKYCIISLVCLI